MVKPMHPVRERGATVAGVEAWKLLFEFFLSLETYWEERAREFGLPEQQTFAVFLLDEPMPMNELAARCKCDPSTLTGVVDRLEARGLVERRPSSSDRRVKVLTLTDEGQALRSRIVEAAYEPHPAFASLAPADQRALRDILRKVFPPAG